MWCFHTSPLPGSGSDSCTSRRIIVDLPAPLAPSTAIRDAKHTLTLTSVSCGTVAPGYVYVMLSILSTARVVELTPSRRSGMGNLNCNVLSTNS